MLYVISIYMSLIKRNDVSQGEKQKQIFKKRKKSTSMYENN